MRRILAVPVLASLASVSVLALQGQTPPVFRATAELVEVIVRVTDKAGRFIPGLTMKDFELRDEGRVQTLVAFDHRSIPRTPTLARGIGQPVLAAPEMSAVATNEGASEARLFVFLLDDMGTPSSHILSVRRSARDFVQRYVADSDFIAVFPTSGLGVMTQEFTRDKTRALAAIDHFLGNDIGGYGSRVLADVTMAIAKHLASIRGRRVSLVWLSANVLEEENFYERQAIDALRRANVTLYLVDPRRLYDRDVAEMRAFGSGEVTQFIPIWGERPYGRPPDVLKDFAEKTGGFAAVNTNDFDVAYDRILDENSQYYVLGFQPSNRGRDGELRRIRVTVPSRPGSQVSARSVYSVSPAGRPGPRPGNVAPTLADAIVSSVPAAGLPLRVQAIPRPRADGQPSVDVVVEVAGKDLVFADVSGQHHLQLEFAYRTIDFLARSANNQTTTLTFKLTPDQLASVRRTGLRWLSTLDLKPGRYSYRVSGQTVGTTQTGLVFTDIDVPKFEPDRLWIGGAALTSNDAVLAITAGTTSAALGLPAPPTTARMFVKGDVITVSAGVVIPPSFGRGSVRLTVHPQTAVQGAAPLIDRTVELANREAANQPRVWAVETAALGAGAFVLRLALSEDGRDPVLTAVLFDVVDR